MLCGSLTDRGLREAGPALPEHVTGLDGGAGKVGVHDVPRLRGSRHRRLDQTDPRRQGVAILVLNSVVDIFQI